MSFEFEFTQDEMSKLTDAQKDAIIDVLVAGMLANATVDERGVEKLDDELATVPFGRSDEELAASIKRAHEKINGFTTAEQAVDLVKASSAALTELGQREKTFALLARVMYADRAMSEDEQTVLTAFYLGFKLDPARVQEIATAVKTGK